MAFLENFEMSDVFKIGVMLLMYTAYMAWEASALKKDFEIVKEHMEHHIIQDNHPIYQTQAILSIVEIQKTHSEILRTLSSDHAACKEIMKHMRERIKDLEIVEAYEHGREYRD